MEFFTISDPSDWPTTMPELKTIDTLLRCGICYEFFDIAMILPKCSHNYCSMCIRRYMSYKSQCPTCNAPAEVSQLCPNRTLDELVSNFKAVRPHILKLCKEDAKKNSSPTSEPEKKETVKETILSPPREQPIRKKSKKSSPFFKDSAPESDEDFKVDSKELTGMETPHRQAQRRSNYQNTRDKITSHASEIASSSNASPAKPAKSSEDDRSTDSDSSAGEPSSVLNRSNEENIDPAYQIPAGGQESDEDVFSAVTPPEPSTSHGQTVTPVTRSEKVECPVCGVPISSKHINVHLDSCLTKSEEKEAKRRVPKRKPLPKIVSSLLSDKEIRKKLKEHGLSSQGNRTILNKRLQEFTLMYNAQCDSSNPVPVETIVKEFNKIDKLKSQPNPIHADQRLKVTRLTPEEEIAKSQIEYLKTHGSHFDDLIKNTAKRGMPRSKKAKQTTNEAQNEPVDPTLPSINHQDPEPKVVAMSGASVHVNGEESSGKGIVCDGSDRSIPDMNGQSDAEKDVELLNYVAGRSSQIGNTNDTSDALNETNVHMKDNDAATGKKGSGGKHIRLKLKRSKYFGDSDKDTSSSDIQVISNEDQTTNQKTLDCGREEIIVENGITMTTKMEENSEEKMDMTEDEMSPVFGQCSVGSSSSGAKTLSGSSTKSKGADGAMTVKQQAEAKPSSSVPSPPTVLLLTDIDTVSEGSSLNTFETFSEAGSHGDIPSPGDINCIPESPEAVENRRPKRVGRRKRKPEAIAEDDGIGMGKETRMTRSRKRGKTSAD